MCAPKNEHRAILKIAPQIAFQELLIETCAEILNQAYGNSLSVQAAYNFYKNNQEMEHMADLLIPSTPCTHIWW